MPSSTVRSFSDPDDYAAAIRGGTVGFTMTGRGDFAAKLVRIDLPRMWMQGFADNLPRIADATRLVSGRVYFTFRTQPGPSLVQGATELVPSAILRHGGPREFFQRSSGAARFGTMSLPIEDAASLGPLAERDLTPPREPTLVAPPFTAIARLQRLHAAASTLAEETPEIIANPEAARGLEQALIGAMVDCLGDRARTEGGLAPGQHAIVMQRFRRVIEENPEQPIYIPEICRAIRVSERSLRACCQEHLGMSPKRYLLLRRMQLARRALRTAEPSATTVTEVAMRCGFWQLGRFAVEYRTLFGESPSATLRRPADAPPPPFAEIA